MGDDQLNEAIPQDSAVRQNAQRDAELAQAIEAELRRSLEANLRKQFNNERRRLEAEF